MAESDVQKGQKGPPGPALITSQPVQGGQRTTLTPAEARAALEELRTLAASAGEHGEQMDRLARTLRENDYRSEVTQVIQESLALPNPNPHVGALWMRRIVTSKGWDRSYPQDMDRLCERGELGRRAVLEFLETAGKKRRPKLVLKALRRHGRWLKEHPKGWSLMAQALTNGGCFAKTVHWTRHWSKRVDADFPALFARAAALRAEGELSRARPVIDAALNMDGPEVQKAELRLWRAQQESLRRNTEAAERDFRELKPVGWGDDALCLFYLVRGIIRVQQATRAERGEAFEAAWQRITDRFRGTRIYLRFRTIRRDYRRCIWRMSVDAGRYGQAMLAWWRSADSWLPLLVLLLVPGLQLLLPVYLYRYLRERKRTKSAFDTL